MWMEAGKENCKSRVAERKVMNKEKENIMMVRKKKVNWKNEAEKERTWGE